MDLDTSKDIDSIVINDKSTYMKLFIVLSPEFLTGLFSLKDSELGYPVVTLKTFSEHC